MSWNTPYYGGIHVHMILTSDKHQLQGAVETSYIRLSNICLSVNSYSVVPLCYQLRQMPAVMENQIY